MSLRNTHASAGYRRRLGDSASCGPAPSGANYSTWAYSQWLSCTTGSLPPETQANNAIAKINASMGPGSTPIPLPYPNSPVSSPSVYLGSSAATPAAVVPVPVVPPASPPSGPIGGGVIVVPSPGSAGSGSSFPSETADMELIEQVLSTYSDTWDNPETIASEIYAAGVQPGDVTENLVLNYLTGITTSSETTPAASTGTLQNFVSTIESDFSSFPAWAWMAGAVGLFFLFGGSKHR